MSWWYDLTQWIQSLHFGVWLVWTLTVVLMLVGVVGTVVPFLPGPVMIFVAAGLHTFLLPDQGMSWWGLALMALLLAASFAVDFFSGAVGSKWFGGSRWGFWGVLVGGIVGLFFGPLGLICGPLIGGFAFEILFAKKRINPAMKATWGTVVGTTMGLALRLLIVAAMVTAFCVDVFWWN